MPAFHLKLEAARARRLFQGLLALSLLASGSDVAQNRPATQQTSSNPMLGTWGTPSPMQDGATLYSFEEFKADGSWRQTTMAQGGRSQGIRTQVWGKYRVQTTGNNLYSVTFQPTGFAPVQACTPGVGCQQMPGYPRTFVNRYVLLDGNHLRSDTQQGLITERVAQIPPELTGQLPATRMFAAAPPVSSGGGTTPSGGGYTPMRRPDGVGGTCDNLQQQRICTINDGYMYTGRDGCQHCSK